MESMKKGTTYREAVQFEVSQRGSYRDLSYTLTFRASSIFFVILNPSINTHIAFMNYWKEKTRSTRFQP